MPSKTSKSPKTSRSTRRTTTRRTTARATSRKSSPRTSAKARTAATTRAKAKTTGRKTTARTTGSKAPTSPFASAFKSAVNRGTPCWNAITNVANRTGKTPKTVCNSLHKAGLIDRCKFNGQWVYWPTFKGKKAPATTTKACQTNMWQHFVDWCIASGFCTPEQLSKHTSSQKAFMTFCRKFWNKQFASGSTSGSTTRRRTSTTKSRSTGRKPSTRSRTTTRNYKFPQTGTRRTRRAA